MLLIDTATPADRLQLEAVLFSRNGRLPVRVTTLGDDRATVCAPRRPDCGSFAFLVRNGVKVPAVIAWAEGDRLGLSFEEALPGRRDALFRAGRA